ncbi:MAG: glycosyltransferase family 4 protein [Chloroflexi bacterium]|nr:glycosyltransferase family 4 protein [Chloroflexota bacterium]
MTRILYIHHGGGLGGAPLSLLYLLRQLDRAKYDPVVLCLRDGPVVEMYRRDGIETIVARGIDEFSHTALEWYGGFDLWRLPGKVLRFWPSIIRTRRYLRELKPDLVHLNSSTLAAPARAARREGIPVVWHIREPLADGYFGLRREWLKRHIHSDAARVIAVSRFDASRLVLSDRVRVIHNFVDFAEFDRAMDAVGARRALGLTPAQSVVTMLGGVARPKGTLPFVRALPLVRRAVPNVRFLVAGPPPRVGASQPLKSFAKFLLGADAYDRAVMAAASEGLTSGHLRFIGMRSDVPQVLAATDVLAFPSVEPHFARPIIEAGAMAKPVVASRLGGPLELVVDGETGLLAPPNDPESLADAIVALLKDPERAAAMGEAGYRRARECFDAEKNARATFAVYDELLASPPRPLGEPRERGASHGPGVRAGGEGDR